MLDQPNPPELPPMAAAASPSPPMAMPAPERFAPMMDRAVRPVPMARRLRQIATALTGGGIAMVVVVFGGEVVLRDDLKPTTLLARIEAQTELGVMNQKLGLAPGRVALTESDYRAKIAEAERTGQAKAELGFQEKLAVVQADKERVVGAYQTLYQRTNLIAQAALQMESVAQQFRQRMIELSNGGRNVVIMFKDFACGLGDPQACASARHDREVMIGEADELSRGDVGKRVRELMSGIDDPATLVTHDDEKRHGTPRLTRD